LVKYIREIKILYEIKKDKYKLIFLRGGKDAAIVDASDYDFLTQWKWFVDKDGYAINQKVIKENEKKKSKRVAMHRLIMGAPKGMDVDHINGNRLDNSRENLRICTRSQNLYNIKKVREHTSRYKGVGWHGQIGKWRAYIRYNFKYVHLGLFLSETEAALAYNEAAIKYHKEYASLNQVSI